MTRGGKRQGAGRKPQGITKKVSLTLTPEEWQEIEESGLTVAAYLKNIMKEVTEIKKVEKDKDNDRSSLIQTDQGNHSIIEELKEENFQLLRQLASDRNELSQVKQRREKGAYARLEEKYQLLGNALIERGRSLYFYNKYLKEKHKEDYKEMIHNTKEEAMFLKTVIENLHIKYITELEWTARSMFDFNISDLINMPESKIEEIFESFIDKNKTKENEA